MIETSAAYKAQVYTLDYARHFVPRALMKIVDLNARTACAYTSASSSFATDFAQLTNEILEVSHAYGTLEDEFFNLGGEKILMPDDEELFGEVGYLGEEMSGADGSFATPLEALICSYSVQVSTVGRVLYFDDTADAVPENFDLVFYRAGTEIARSLVRNNALYIYTDTLSVQRYDKMILLIYDMSLPYRRPRIVEDIPGVYLHYNEENIISIMLTQPVDIFSTELVAGELDIGVENASKLLDILNPTGFEKFLQRRQVIEINLDMVFPDGSTEAIPLGKLYLVDWKTDKGALAATFVARDAVDNLTLGEYIKGTLPSSPISFYELAEVVLIDAGITDYTIDAALYNIYTNACLPIATHKELLRMIAQASQSVVISTLTGGIRIRYFSPLLLAYNVIENPCFNSDFTDWTQIAATLSTSQVYVGKQSVVLTASSSLAQAYTFLADHVYYIRAHVWQADALVTGTAGIYVSDTMESVNFAEANLAPEVWSGISLLYSGGNGTAKVLSVKNIDSEDFNVGAVLCIDLTLLYGTGNEPTADWCDTTIRFFIDSLSVPRAVEPIPVDTLDYTVLFDAPEITAQAVVKAVETNIYDYNIESSTSEIYKGTRYITGTEEFSIKFSSIASNCTITVESLDESGTATVPNTASLLSSEIYAQAAKIKIVANSSVQIIVTGYKVSVDSNTYRAEDMLEASVVADTPTVSIDNKLITLRTVAEDVTAYALYWYNRAYQYNFEWRQNPAVENLDTVTVYDDFAKNNGVLLTERNIEYNDGVVSGASKGLF